MMTKENAEGSALEFQRGGRQLAWRGKIKCLLIKVCWMKQGEGVGTPLQCSCLENPRDGGAWWAAVYGVAQSLT